MQGEKHLPVKYRDLDKQHKAIITDQDGNAVTIKYFDDEEMAVVQEYAPKNGGRVFLLVAETDNGRKVIGIFPANENAAFEALIDLKQGARVRGDLMFATDFLELIGENSIVYLLKGYDMTALELLNSW